ncbi:MAG: glycosyltransferase [Hydrogenophaga sp.]|nr:glycosyltransferase [Hydrogenophaga sp.]
MRIDLFHNIRWSRYKAAVFSELHRLTSANAVDLRITQIADTSVERVALSGVDLSYHSYPHTLLFKGSYQSIPKWKLVVTLFILVWRSDANLILMPGFNSLEHWGMMLAAVLRRKKRATFCDSTLKDRPQSIVKGLLKRIFFFGCHGVFCYGQRSRQYLLHYGVPASRIHLRCQAAALPGGYTPAKAIANRLQCSPPTQVPRFVYVGRLSPEKGLETLMEAFAKVHLSWNQSKMIIIGNGPLLKILQRQALSLGLDNAVEFTGSMGPEALSEQYTNATCLVLPSQSEPWGLVVNEALHYGCPVVVSDNCGCVPELVIDGVTGYRFATENPDDLHDKLIKLVKEFDNVQATAVRCLDIISHFTPETAALQMLEGCKKVLSE